MRAWWAEELGQQGAWGCEITEALVNDTFSLRRGLVREDAGEGQGRFQKVFYSVLVSCGHWSKAPEVGWLKPTEMYSPAALESNL